MDFDATKITSHLNETYGIDATGAKPIEGGHLFRIPVAESELNEPSFTAAVHLLNESGDGIVAPADIRTVP